MISLTVSEPNVETRFTTGLYFIPESHFDHVQIIGAMTGPKFFLCIVDVRLCIRCTVNWYGQDKGPGIEHAEPPLLPVLQSRGKTPPRVLPQIRHTSRRGSGDPHRWAMSLRCIWTARVSPDNNVTAGPGFSHNLVGQDLPPNHLHSQVYHSPRWSLPNSGPGGTPSATACSRLNRPGGGSSSGCSRGRATRGCRQKQ